MGTVRILCLLLSMVATLPAQALLPWHRANADQSEGSFSADRPGFGTSPDVVGTGVSQLETGFSFSQSQAGEHMERATVIGSPLLRVGIARGIELRSSTDGFNRVSSRENVGGAWQSSRGLSDTTIGAKIALLSASGWFPAVSLIPSLTTPTGARAFTAAAWDPSLALAWSLSLPARLAIGGTFAASSQTSGGRRFLDRSASLALSRTLKRNWSVYGEAYLDKCKLLEGNRQWSFDGGVSRLVGHHLQIDLESGTSMVRQGSSWFVSGGVSFRLPNTLRRTLR